ncbi:MAG: alpha/beta hydrolase [Bacillaceae bacterium]|nr:alpha/beta hydrolase [Bacillaceae bacterium]
MLHGFSLDHRMMATCFEPVFQRREGWQRLYIDLPGMGKTKGADWIKSSDDILQVLLQFIDTVIPDQRFLIAGESYGAYLAGGILKKKREWIDGMALICPMIKADVNERILPPHRVVRKEPGLASQLEPEAYDVFKSLAVIQTQEVLNRFHTDILEASSIADHQFLQRIKEEGYALSCDPDHYAHPYEKPVLIVTGRQDAVTGYQDAFGLLQHFPRSSYIVMDGAGHNLQIEQPDLFENLVHNWLDRVEEERAG